MSLYKPTKAELERENQSLAKTILALGDQLAAAKLLIAELKTSNRIAFEELHNKRCACSCKPECEKCERVRVLEVEAKQLRERAA